MSHTDTRFQAQRFKSSTHSNKKKHINDHNIRPDLKTKTLPKKLHLYAWIVKEKQMTNNQLVVVYVNAKV